MSSTLNEKDFCPHRSIQENWFEVAVLFHLSVDPILIIEDGFCLNTLHACYGITVWWSTFPALHYYTVH